MGTGKIFPVEKKLISRQNLYDLIFGVLGILIIAFDRKSLDLI